MTNEGKGTIVFADEGQNLTQWSDVQSLSEETIDLSTLFVNDVSSSGSFDLRHSRLSFFEKFLEAIPIPTLLVNELGNVVYFNRACKKVTGDRDKLEGKHFKILFPNPVDQDQVEKLIDKVLRNRIPLIAEGVLGIDEPRFRGRVHMRPLRVKSTRIVLVVIEDLRP
jgi:PAS domain S-box-containing protein